MKTNWVQIFNEDKISVKEFTRTKVKSILQGDYTQHVRHEMIDWMERNSITNVSELIIYDLIQYISTEYVKKLDSLVNIFETCKYSDRPDVVAAIIDMFIAFGPSNVKEVAELLCEKQKKSLDMYLVNTLVRSRNELIDFDASVTFLKDTLASSLQVDDVQGVVNYFYGMAITRFIQLDEMVNLCPPEKLNDLVMSMVNNRSLCDNFKDVIHEQANHICDNLIQYGIGKYAVIPVLVEVLNMMYNADNIDTLISSLPVGVRYLVSPVLDWDDVQENLDSLSIEERIELFSRNDIPYEFMTKNAGVIAHFNLVIAG